MTGPAGQQAAAVLSPEHATIDMTKTGVVTSWNPAAVLLYGYQEEEIVSRSADILCPAARRSEEADVLQRVTAGGRTERYEADRVCKDGTVVTVSVTAAPIISPAGAVVGVSAVSWKATGPQAALDQAEGTIDSERRDAREIQERTDTQRRRARDAQERTDVRADTQRQDARDAQERIDVQAGSQRRDARDTQDQTEAAQDSERRDAQDLFDARRDSERREALAQNEGLHAQVQQIQRMDSLGELAGGVAHDFNNLLAIILSYVTFVSHRIAEAAESGGDQSWDQARADVVCVQQAVERAAALSRQLLAFASREAIRPVALNLNEVIADVEELLRRAVGGHITLTTSLADGLWPILADPGRLEQVLVNLAVNARDAMPGGGTLTIVTENIVTENITTAADSARGEPDPHQEHHVQLQVSDTGTGMTAAVVERAFEPFFTTKDATRGTGLGLATVYGILTQAGGHIQISSQPGNGTTFTISLPVTDEAAAPARKLAPSSWEPHGETILLVEDDSDLREATGRIFAAAGYDVVAAASGPEALETARNHHGPIDLLVTDIVMPHMLGTEVAEIIRVIKPGAAELYMSGYAWPVHAPQTRLGPDAILVDKPFSDADLLAKAGQALADRNRGLRTSKGNPRRTRPSAPSPRTPQDPLSRGGIGKHIGSGRRPGSVD
jgi:two-component system cell cycle sensor histidine kinase/response regulator CckA